MNKEIKNGVVTSAPTQDGVGLGRVVELASQLAEKQTWVRKGLKELIEKVNRELMGIQETHSAWYRYKVADETEDYYMIVWHYANGNINLEQWDYNRYRDLDIDTLPTWIIREAIECFPDFIRSVISQLQELNEEYDEAKDALRKYLS